MSTRRQLACGPKLPPPCKITDSYWYNLRGQVGLSAKCFRQRLRDETSRIEVGLPIDEGHSYAIKLAGSYLRDNLINVYKWNSSQADKYINDMVKAHAKDPERAFTPVEITPGYTAGCEPPKGPVHTRLGPPATSSKAPVHTRLEPVRRKLRNRIDPHATPAVSYL